MRLWHALMCAMKRHTWTDWRLNFKFGNGSVNQYRLCHHCDVTQERTLSTEETNEPTE